MSGGDWRTRVRDRYREQSRAALANLGSGPVDENDYESAARRAHLAALREIDPRATLDEELRVRLVDPVGTASGALPVEWGNALLKPLQDAVSAGVIHGALAFELAGLSSGSTVLHLRPTRVGGGVSDEDTLPTEIDTSPADHAVRDLVKLTNALETEGDVNQWQHMLTPVDAVVSALERFDLDMHLRWFARDGSVRSSAMTRRGRTFAASLRSTADQVTRISITGRITELREAGVVKVKTGPNRRDPAYEVHLDHDQLLEMRCALGDQVSYVAERHVKVDRVGRIQSTRYVYLGPGGDAMELPILAHEQQRPDEQ